MTIHDDECKCYSCSKKRYLDKKEEYSCLELTFPLWCVFISAILAGIFLAWYTN